MDCIVVDDTGTGNVVRDVELDAGTLRSNDGDAVADVGDGKGGAVVGEDD